MTIVTAIGRRFELDILVEGAGLATITQYLRQEVFEKRSLGGERDR